MQANYHTHTVRCNHAVGTERDYIEKAIEAGMKVLGFSDHVPYPFPKSHVSDFRMRIDQIEEYIETLSDLREEYKSDIDILIGFETEYYPAYFYELIGILNQYEYDYLILGQHFMENETSGKYSGARTKDEEYLKAYVDQTIEAMETGYFSYFAHPDIVNYVGNPEIYKKHILRLCKCAKKMDMPLEINMLGVSDNRHYPSEKFFKIAAEAGNEIILGCDAHYPDAINDPETLKKATSFAEKLGLKPLDFLKIKNPKKQSRQRRK